MAHQHSPLRGLWLPLITPFRDGEVDETSLRRLARHYAAEPVDGLILAATTGEELTLNHKECGRIVGVVTEELAEARVTIPVYLGLSGSDTGAGIDDLQRTASWAVDGYLISCPYYTRPSQEGLVRHFAALAGNTARPILIYNIPYRTGVNLLNDAMLALAREHDNIVGVKDCCADAAQSFDLLCRRPDGFAVLTGEDAQFYTALTQGSDGGILASAHVLTGAFAAVRSALAAGDHVGALSRWRALATVPSLLFAEPSPAAVKHWLWRIGLIDSPELRLPMTGVTRALAHRIDAEIEQRSAQPLRRPA